MAVLSEYRNVVQGWLRERNQQSINARDIDHYINRARREVAMRSQCIRVLSPVSGPISSIQVGNGGSNYTDPTLTITSPDFPSGQLPYPAGLQATATAIVTAGRITGATITQSGSGYFQPVIMITDPTGSGAVLTAQTTPIMTTQQAQEVIPFSTVPITAGQGIGQVYFVQSVSMIYNNYRYSLAVYPFTLYQGVVRRYAQQYQFVPVVGAQYGQGTNGSLFVYPVPQTIYQIELDCYCMPTDLTNDTSPEAIALPWTEAVPYFATHLAFQEKGDLNSARYYFELHDQMCHRYSAWARPGRISNVYGRTG